jgi:hypothetical protein
MNHRISQTTLHSTPEQVSHTLRHGYISISLETISIRIRVKINKNHLEAANDIPKPPVSTAHNPNQIKEEKPTSSSHSASPES